MEEINLIWPVTQYFLQRRADYEETYQFHFLIIINTEKQQKFS